MLDFVLEAMVDAVIVVDAEGRITLANSGAAHLTGYTREELCALHVTKLLTDDSSGMRTVVRRRIEDGSVVRREEAWLIAKDGTGVPVSVTGSPVLDAGNAVQGIVLVARDVREIRQLLADKEAEIARRREVEEELRAAKASIQEQLDLTRTQLLLAERRATLGTLAGGVGHELRNIAQVQVAAVDELRASLDAGEDMALAARRMLPELDRVGDHITTHGRRLMQLARPGPDHVAPLAIGDVVRDVAEMLRLAGKLARVEIELSLAPMTVTVNRTRIEQILVNLIINAVDALEGKGKITIEVQPSTDGKRAVCSVTDTGTGIPPEQQERIFEPFYTTKSERGGTGLGLPVVREIVSSYGGKLRVSSTPGAGTTFTFDLPC